MTALTRLLAVGTIAAWFGIHALPIAAQAAPSRLQLTLDANGVHLVASQVTVREILAEWARQCGCYVVNADRLPGGPLPVPIQFDGVPQAKVLESLLRQASGYVLTPRRPGSAGPSDFETIYILPTSTASASAAPFTGYAPPSAVPIATTGSPDDEIPPVTPLAQPSASTQPDPVSPSRPASAGVSVVPVMTIPPASTRPPQSGAPQP
jgi:hypothetical protein